MALYWIGNKKYWKNFEDTNTKLWIHFKMLSSGSSFKIFKCSLHIQIREWYMYRYVSLIKGPFYLDKQNWCQIHMNILKTPDLLRFHLFTSFNSDRALAMPIEWFIPDCTWIMNLSQTISNFCLMVERLVWTIGNFCI